MAQQLVNVGGAINDGTGEVGPRGWLQKFNANDSELYLSANIWAKTVNASLFAGATNEAKITAAIAFAVANGKTAVYVLGSMLPYTASLVTFNANVLMLRETESGDVGLFDVRAYGAAGTGLVDDTASFLAPLAAAAPSGADGTTATVFAPTGVYLITAQLAIPNKVRLIGAGRSATVIRASASFPPSTALIRLGQGAGIVFGSRLENINIDCNSVAGSIGIYTSEANEGCGIFYGIVNNFKAYGFQLDSVNAQHTCVDVAEIYGASGATAGVFYNGTAGAHSIRRTTINGNAGGVMGDGVIVSGANALADVHGFHCEQVTNGVRFTSSGKGTVLSAQGHSSVTSVVRIDSSPGNGIACHGIYGNGATNTISYGVDSSVFTVDMAHFQAAGSGGMVVRTSASGNGWLVKNTGARATIVTDSVARVESTNVTDVGNALTVRQSGTGVAVNVERGVIATPLFALTDAATVTIDGSRANCFSLQTTAGVGATRAMGAPSNPTNGVRIQFIIYQDGTGGRAVTWNAVFKQAWSDTGNTLNKRSSIAFIYDGSSWNQDGAQSPYI